MKETKEQVDYGAGMPRRHCGICKFYIKHTANQGTCKKVRGIIDPRMWCRRFVRKNKK